MSDSLKMKKKPGTKNVSNYFFSLCWEFSSTEGTLTVTCVFIHIYNLSLNKVFLYIFLSQFCFVKI